MKCDHCNQEKPVCRIYKDVAKTHQYSPGVAVYYLCAECIEETKNKVVEDKPVRERTDIDRYRDWLEKDVYRIEITLKRAETAEKKSYYQGCLDMAEDQLRTFKFMFYDEDQ